MNQGGKKWGCPIHCPQNVCVTTSADVWSDTLLECLTYRASHPSPRTESWLHILNLTSFKWNNLPKTRPWEESPGCWFGTFGVIPFHLFPKLAVSTSDSETTASPSEQHHKKHKLARHLDAPYCNHYNDSFFSSTKNNKKLQLANVWIVKKFKCNIL